MSPLFHDGLAEAGSWTLALAILAVWTAAGWFLVRILFGRINRWLARAPFQFENMLLKSLPAPLTVLVVLTGFMAAFHFSRFLEKDVDDIMRFLKAGLVLAGFFLADRVLQGLLKDVETRQETFKNSHFLFSALIHMGVWTLGGLMVLEGFGISITPLVASLGVGSLAVALALQNTLANLFSGIYLLIDKPIQVGQFVRLGSGEEGYVEMIGWRSTRVRLLANNTVVIPNSKLAENQILNYYLPETQCAVLVEVGVDYGSDLSRVEKVTVEVAGKVQRTVQGAVKDFEPFIRYHTFADSSVNFSVILRAHEFVDNYLIKHEFIKLLHERYRAEGITIPFPQRTVEIKGNPPPGGGPA